LLIDINIGEIYMASYSKHMYCIETMRNMDGKQLKSIKADTNGYYTLPFCCLGDRLRSGNMYDEGAMLECLFGKNSRFRMAVEESSLIGELEHPTVHEPPTTADLKRILSLDASNACFHIGKVWLDTDVVPNKKLVVGKIKPIKPHGHIVKESLEDPSRNSSTSLRSLVNIRSDGVRIPTHITTFDFVQIPGDMRASKWYSPSTESFNSIDITDVIQDCIQFTGEHNLSLESYINPSFLKYFKSPEVVMSTESIGFVVNTPKALKIMNQLTPKSPSHALLKSILGA
jgi:hypothetical protein